MAAREHTTRWSRHPAAALLAWATWFSACSPNGDVDPAFTTGSSSDGGVPNPPRSLCGQSGEPCCVPPLRACASGYQCNRDAGLCEAQPLDSTTIRICRSPSDCPLSQGCCPTGLVSTCVALGPTGECPLPDLSIINDTDDQSVFTSQVEANSCEAACVSSGQHRLLELAGLAVVNNGAGDVLLGGPGMPSVEAATTDIAACDYAVSYVEGMLRLEVLGLDGNTISGTDAKFAPGCYGPPQGSFDCAFLGMLKGTVSSSMLCALVLLDGIPPGDYVVRVTLDPSDRIAERDETNNTLELPLTLFNPDPLGECSPGQLESTPNGQRPECGWKPSLAAACAPGESLVVGCPDCDGDPVLRVCANPEFCSEQNAVTEVDDGPVDLCPEAQFECPETGRFSTFTSLWNPLEPGTCNVARVSGTGAGIGP